MVEFGVRRQFSFDHLRERCFSLFVEMRRKKELCDITFRGRELSISAHQVIISAAFPGFWDQFFQSVDKTQDIIPDTLTCMIHHGYTPEEIVDTENVKSLLTHACCLHTEKLREHLSAHFKEKNKRALMFRRFNKMRKDKYLCDIKFGLGRTYIYAHRVILAAAIPYFRDAFSKGVCAVSGIEPNALQCLIDYAYKHEIKIDANNALSLLAAARCLGVDDVEKACSDFFSDGLKTEIWRNERSKARISMTYRSIDSKLNIWGGALLPKIRKTFYCFKTQSRRNRTGERESQEHSEIPFISNLNNRVVPTLQSCRLLRRKGWITGNPETFSNAAGSAVHLQDKMYFFCLYITWRYDPQTCSLLLMRSMPTCRHFVGATALKNKIYICGGMLRNSKGADVVECFDPATDEWTTVKSMPKSRGGLSAVTFRGHIFAIGGAHSDTSLDIVEKYDPKRDTWTSMSPMLDKRCFAAAATLFDRIYVYGGISSLGVITTGEQYDPIHDMWVLISSPNSARECSTLLSFERGPYANKGSNDVRVNNLDFYELEFGPSRDPEFYALHDFVMSSVDALV